MTKTRGQWIRFLLAGLFIAAASIGLPSARAQGFGPDPFRPLNSQYDPYIYPMSSPNLAAGGAASALGGRRDNQMQQYLEQQAGAERGSSERYGIGVPHWRARSEQARFQPEFKPNRRAERRPYSTLESINQKYLAYFSEDDPRKQAVLLREFDTSRRGTSDDRDGATDGANRRMRARSGEGSADRPSSRTSRGGADAGMRGQSRRASDASDEAGSGEIPPAPRVRGSARGTTKKERSPSDILKRSLDDDDDDTLPIRRRRAAPSTGTPSNE